MLQNIQTSVVKSNLNPIWNEELMLSVPQRYGPVKLVRHSFFIISFCSLCSLSAMCFLFSWFLHPFIWNFLYGTHFSHGLLITTILMWTHYYNLDVDSLLKS